MSGAALGLGITSLVLGIIVLPASMFCVCVGWLAMPVGIVGLILGVIGAIIPFVTNRRGVIIPTIGSVVCLAAIGWTIASSLWFAKSAADGINANADNFAKAAAEMQEVARKEQELIQQQQERARIEQEKLRQEDLLAPRANASAKETQDAGDVTVSVTAAAIESPDPFTRRFVIRLHLENRGLDRINYKGWGNADVAGSPQSVKLVDNQGIETRLQRMGVPLLPGQVKQTTLSPGKSSDDVLYFQTEPAVGVEYLDLDLAQTNLGIKTGKLRFRIPAAMITRPIDKPGKPGDPGKGDTGKKPVDTGKKLPDTGKKLPDTSKKAPETGKDRPPQRPFGD